MADDVQSVSEVPPMAGFGRSPKRHETWYALL